MYASILGELELPLIFSLKTYYWKMTSGAYAPLPLGTYQLDYIEENWPWTRSWHSLTYISYQNVLADSGMALDFLGVGEFDT